MKLNQLSVFLENRPGRLSHPCKALADAGINIATLSVADTHQFGIMRIIVADPQTAKSVLEDAGCVVNVTEVVAMEVADRPGGLAEVLAVLEDAGVNVEYMYAFTFRSGEEAIIVFRFENADAAINLLEGKGVTLVDPDALFGPGA